MRKRRSAALRLNMPHHLPSMPGARVSGSRSTCPPTFGGRFPRTMKNLCAAAIAIGLGIMGMAASTALLPPAPSAPAGASVNVTQHHNNLSRDGLFIDPAFTPSAAANLARDLNFDGTIVGNVYAQPLYVEDGPDSRAKVIAVTESNNVYALDAITGTIIWQRKVGPPAPGMGLISPVGITGTPVIDLASRALILVAVISGPNNMIYSLNVDTGVINPGFPIDVNASFPDFSSSLHMQRGALTLLGNMVYVPYGGYADIGNYRGRVLGVSLDGSQLGSWATTSLKSGIWTPGGIASDGTKLYVATGNAPGGTTPWGGSEAIIRLQPGPVSVDRPRIIGRRQIGSRSTAATSTWAALIRSLSMSRARRLRRWWSRWAKIGTLTCLIATISAAWAHPSHNQSSRADRSSTHRQLIGPARAPSSRCGRSMGF